MAEVQVFYEKVVTYNIKAVRLCSTKDLLAIVTEDDSVLVKRISHQVKKVAAIDEDLAVETVCFKDDGEALAIGFEDGSVKVYVISSTSLALFSQHKLHSARIVEIEWFPFNFSSSPKRYQVEKFISIEDNNRSTISGFSMISSLDELGNLGFFVNGIYPLSFIEAGQRGRCRKVKIEREGSQIVCLHSGGDGWVVKRVDVSIVRKKAAQIQEVAEIFAKCQNFVKVIVKAVREVVKEANSVCNSFVGRYLDGIEEAVKKSGLEETVEELLSQCAGTGVISACLSKFIKEEMQNTKAITQYEEKLNLLVKNCQITMIQDCKNSITGLLFFFTTLINCSKCAVYSPLGINADILTELVNTLNNLLHKVTATMGLLSETHSDIVNTIHWLHNWNIKLAKEDEQTDTAEEWSVDLSKLINYFGSSSRLYFKPLSLYLKGSLSEDLSSITRLWTEFSNRIPKSIPAYFKEIFSLKLSEFEYNGAELSVLSEKIVVGLFCQTQIDVFEVQGNTSVTYSIKCRVDPKYLYYNPSSSKCVFIRSDNGTNQICEAKKNEMTAIYSYPGEETTAFSYSYERNLACLITNERSLKIFDLEIELI